MHKIFEKAEGLRQKSEYIKSRELFAKALKGYTSAEDLRGVLDCQLALGDVCRMTGNFDDALNHYLHAITTAKILKDPVSAADAHINIGLSFRGKGDWKNALKMSGKALAFYLKHNDAAATAFALWVLAG